MSFYAPKGSVNRIEYLPPVKIAPFKCMDKCLSSGNISSHRNVVNIAKPQQVHFIGLMGLGTQRVPEKEQQIDLIA